MPLKSKAQLRKFYVLKKRGKMSQATIDQWVKETPGEIKDLPERLHKKAFVESFCKEAGIAQSLGRTVKKIGPKKLEYAGLGMLGAIPAHEVYEGVKKKDKQQVAKGALDAAGLGTLALATHLAHK